ncbi:DUF5324 family protein [Planotetraspora sp. A-T 1434]|uniref:DUF5324 family protein n=1 Tax=Planotetraspora sp. A-T 1434 TaxID=2979219 RepID=UPI0021BF6EE5|nr:DUF5324 family protein [Planotetraspora sp. A-T 1434]MCT9931775.1 DUF5324 family protein [Planotetraspora sp. A-T 1434]
MSLTMKKRRRAEVIIPRSWLGQVKVQARKAGNKVSPVAETARDVATHRVEDARVWAAPKIDQAAHSVEDQIAPMVSAFLADLARKVDVPPRAKARRRWPVLALLAGAAIGAVGVAMYRNNAQRWTDTMKDSLRHTGADASKWVGDRAEQTADTVNRAAETVNKKADTVGKKSNDISGKLS